MNLTLLLACAAISAGAAPRPTVVVVIGAEGTAEYGTLFRDWAGRWSQAAGKGHAAYVPIGLADAAPPSEPAAATDRDLLQSRLAEHAGEGEDPLWLILIGHGTFDGKTARFNLRGPDVSAADLKEWLAPIRRPLAVINCSSCSGPFLNELSGPNRVIVTATRSGHEYNFTRFGDFLSTAIADPAADLDKDEQTSLLEAYLAACARLHEFYQRDGRLMTEHALLDNNGDLFGTPPDWFQGVRAIKTAKTGASPDGRTAARWHLIPGLRESQLPPDTRQRRDQLEQDLARLRDRKTELDEAEYLNQLERLLVELARLYEQSTE